jgi:hypothetical protein
MGDGDGYIARGLEEGIEERRSDQGYLEVMTYPGGDPMSRETECRSMYSLTAECKV